jgi:hypothetical protein
MQLHIEVLLSAGMLPSNTVGDPGLHGATVAGTQGIGVSTPMAAEVAAATTGFAMDMHMPKVGMFIMGLLSMIFAAGGPPHMVLLVGSTTKALGATPNEHIIIAPATTCWAIGFRGLFVPVNKSSFAQKNRAKTPLNSSIQSNEKLKLRIIARPEKLSRLQAGRPPNGRTCRPGL